MLQLQASHSKDMFCQFPFRRIFYYGTYESTGKETEKRTSVHGSDVSMKLTTSLESDLILYFGIFMNILHLALVTLFVLVVTRHPFPYRFFMLFLQAE